MARINTHPSHASAIASSRQATETPVRGDSDQENRDPRSQGMDKGKARANELPEHSSLPTPSDSSGEARGQKRKRTEVQRGTNEHDEGGDDDDVVEATREQAKFNRYFDPNQDADERREVKRKSRALEREFQETRDDLLRDSGSALTRTVQKANKIYKSVKQTNDATLDSRLLVNVSNLAYKKTAQLVLGDASTGIDVDEFLSKCITYMRNGGPLDRDREDAPSSSRRRRTRDGEDEEEDEDVVAASLDWGYLGRYACFPYNSRPCVPSFLLGPLSVEKTQRTQTQRRARQSKETTGREARAEALTREDLHQTDENALTAICQRINKHLNEHVRHGERVLSNAGLTPEDLQTPRGRTLLKQNRLADNGGVSLFDYVLNPRSFGQTIENLFYVSFIIKEGNFGIENDSDGLPTIFPARPRTLEEQRKSKTSKHQAVFSLDYATWESLVKAFDIREPLIPHRQDDVAASTQVGQRGWYT